MDDDTSLEVPIAVRVRGVPKVHPAAAVLTIGRRHEVRVVVPATVLRVRNDGIVLLPTTTKVVLLEVAGNLGEAVAVVQVMNEVGGVEKLSYGRVDVLLCLLERIFGRGLLRLVRVVESLRRASIGAIIGQPVVATLPVLMSEDVVTPGRRRVPDRGGVLETKVLR